MHRQTAEAVHCLAVLATLLTTTGDVDFSTYIDKIYRILQGSVPSTRTKG